MGLEEKEFNFKDSNIIGSIGEAIMLEYLRQHGFWYHSVADDKEFQKKDIDCVFAKSKTQQDIFIQEADQIYTGHPPVLYKGEIPKIYCGESKADTTPYLNLFFELFSNITNPAPDKRIITLQDARGNEITGSIGCMLQTEAHKLFYYSIDREILYVILAQKFKEWGQWYADLHTLETKYIRNRNYYTVGWAIPISAIKSDSTNSGFIEEVKMPWINLFSDDQLIKIFNKFPTNLRDKYKKEINRLWETQTESPQ